MTHILEHFSLPYSGMKDGLHEYEFAAGPDFFREFPASPIENGEFSVRVRADKRPGMMDLHFEINGRVPTTCDKCLADIKLPVRGDFSMLVKVGDDKLSDDEVLFIKDDQAKIDLSQVMYELICLSLPMVNVYDCGNDNPVPCNKEVLEKLGRHEESETDEPKNATFWEGLKELDLE
jgi:uncharacterized protein